MKQNTSDFSVNRFAPKGGELAVFFKKVGPKKSDGFALIENGEIYIIDSGLKEDTGLLDFLLALREKWLSNAPEQAKIQNPDTVGALVYFTILSTASMTTLA